MRLCKNNVFLSFSVVLVAANLFYPGRKAFNENLAAMAKFIENHNDVFFYLHTNMVPKYGRTSQGIFLTNLFRKLGVKPNRYSFVDQNAYQVGLPTSYLVDVYRSSDALLAASCWEGFGLPLIEAQAE